jgi:uncharacterized membrane protein
MISNASARRRSEGTVNTGDILRCAIFAIAVALPAFADDAARVSRLESEIQQLRTQLDEQNRRIQRLEAELARRSGAKEASQATKPAASENRARPAASAGPQPWHAAASWSRVAKGMSAQEVIAILGEPTSIEAVEGFKTLFYRGTNAVGAGISGIVNLRDEQVVAIVKPAF